MTQRTILFRGKSIESGEWVEGYFGIKGEGTDLEKSFIMQSEINTKFSGYPFYFADIEVDPATVGQFTGNEDTNGTMVWEGSTIENCDTKDLQEVYWNLNESAWYCRYIGQNRIVSLADSLGNLNTVIK